MPYATLPIFISRIRTTCMPAVIAIMFSAIAAKANDSDLDSNGMSPLNHARYEFDNCEEFTQLKNSGIEEYDYIDQILAGRTRHSPDDIKRIRQIRAEFKKISNQLKKAKKYQYRDVIDHLKELQDYDEGGDPPYTETIYELTAHYYRDNLIKIEWIRAMNTPSEDTVSVFFDTTQRPLFAFTRRLESSRYHSQSRFYYDENGKTIAVAT